jgi:hypothetical protein
MAGPTAIEGRDVRADLASVGPNGAVATQSGAATVNLYSRAVGLSSITLVSALPERVQIEIQNKSNMFILYVRLDASVAGLTDMAVYPQETWRFPPGVTYTGEIRGWSNAAPPMQVAIVEFKVVRETGTM